MNVLPTPGALRLYAPGRDALDFELIATPIVELLSAGGSSFVTIEDQIVTTHTAASYFNNYSIALVISEDVNRLVDRVSPESSNEAIATLVDGLLTRVADGTVTVLLRTALGSFGVSCNMTQYAGSSVQTKIWAPGFLAHEVSTQITNRLPGEQPLFTVANHSTKSFVRNAAFWGADLDLTCISPSNDASGPYRAGVAVTPKHVIYARHYPLYVGDVIYFVTADNVTVARTIVAVTSMAGDVWDEDIGIASLDSDLPASITPCKVPPADFENKLPNFGDGVLAWGTAANESGYVRELSKVANQTIVFNSFNRDIVARDYYVNLQSGDSGSPVFLVVEDELMLLCCITTGYNGQGSAIWRHLAALNAIIAGMDPGYSLTTKDLSAYTSF